MFELEDRLWWYDGMRAITASLLDRNLPQSQSLKFLDVGCGTGFSLVWLRERLGSDAAFGVDASTHAAGFWSLRGVDTAAVASAHRLPFASCEFDLVTFFDVIYQFPRPEAEEAVSEVKRVLRPGGILFIREPAYDWMRGAHDLAIGTRHRFTLSEVRGLLTGQGFRIRRATYANSLLFGAAVAHRTLSRLKGRAESDVKPVSAWMNGLFRSALKLEARVMKRLSLPFGLSVIVIAEKAAQG
jgi:SAM-dependent methyltransferase